MRQIKYRYWNGNDKKMFYKDTWDNFPAAGENECFLEWTGLKDKNGKEIYEGDIVKYMYLNTSPVEERVSEVKLMAIGDVNRNIQAYYPFCYSIAGSYKEEKREVTECFLTPSEACEIIGNIYSTPELLDK